MNKEFEMAFQLEDIVDIEDNGYCNCVDIMTDGEHNFILANGLVSHNSALGGLMPVLGRENVGYYTLKGKPLNAYSQSQKKFTENKELTGLYQIIKNGVEEADLPDGNFYELNLNGKTIIANENDEVQIDGNWVSVKSLIDSEF